MNKISIKNRYGLKMVGVLSVPENPVGCAFVIHGLGGTKEQEHILVLADTLLENRYTVFNFDTTNSIGESEGKYEEATMQKHYEDLVDVITWAKTQSWFAAPFVLAGHSLGAYAVAQYAENYPEEVKAVFPFATTVSGKLSFESTTKFEPEKFKAWKETGWTMRVSNTKPGLELHLPWSHMEERLNHDLTLKVSNLTMPVLILGGEEDGPCPSEQQKLLFDMLPPNTHNEFHIIKGAPHTFRNPEHLKQLKDILDAWLKKIS